MIIMVLLVYLAFIIKRQSRPHVAIDLNNQVRAFLPIKNAFLDEYPVKFNKEKVNSSHFKKPKINGKLFFSPNVYLIELDRILIAIEQEERQKIRALQQLLIDLDYPDVKVTGYFDRKSKKALQRYAKDFNLRIKIEVTREIIEQLRISKALYESTE